MKILRWKPLKSSVRTARNITNFLDAISTIWLGLLILVSLGLVIAGIGNGTGYPVLAGIIVGISGFFSYYFFKMSYVALQLLTEIADDIRLQLLAVAGDEYDQAIADQEEEKEEPTKSDLDEDEKRDVFDAAVAGYKRGGGNKASIFENSTVYNSKEVILRDADNKRIITMVLYDGQWIKA